MSGDLIIGLRFPEKLEKIELALADRGLVTVAAIRGRGIAREIVEVRHLIWGLAYQDLGLSYSRIGRLYGKNHTSIMDGVRNAKRSGNLKAARAAVNDRFPGLLRV